jgi:hypothetical protein
LAIAPDRTGLENTALDSSVNPISDVLANLSLSHSVSPTSHPDVTQPPSTPAITRSPLQPGSSRLPRPIPGFTPPLLQLRPPDNTGSHIPRPLLVPRQNVRNPSAPPAISASAPSRSNVSPPSDSRQNPPRSTANLALLHDLIAGLPASHNQSSPWSTALPQSTSVYSAPTPLNVPTPSGNHSTPVEITQPSKHVPLHPLSPTNLATVAAANATKPQGRSAHTSSPSNVESSPLVRAPSLQNVSPGLAIAIPSHYSSNHSHLTPPPPSPSLRHPASVTQKVCPALCSPGLFWRINTPLLHFTRLCFPRSLLLLIPSSSNHSRHHILKTHSATQRQRRRVQTACRVLHRLLPRLWPPPLLQPPAAVKEGLKSNYPITLHRRRPQPVFPHPLLVAAEGLQQNHRTDPLQQPCHRTTVQIRATVQEDIYRRRMAAFPSLQVPVPIIT